MDDDDKAELARSALRAAELLEPGKIASDVKEHLTSAAEDVALRGIAAVGRLTGKARSPARERAVVATDLGDPLADWDAADAAELDRRIHAAAAKKGPEDDSAPRESLAALRRSFPEESRELALLIFNCVDLLEDLSEDAEGDPPPAAELARREVLLERLAKLLAPTAGDALESFVARVIEISRRHRAAG